jgi:hypothetical protein
MKFIIPVVLLVAVLSSCSNSKVTGIATTTIPLYVTESEMDTLRIIPTGSVLEYAGEGPTANFTNSGRVKVRFNNKEGYVYRYLVVFNAKPAVMTEKIENVFFPGSTVTDNRFVVYDSLTSDSARVYRFDVHAYEGSWYAVNEIDLDTANAAVAAMADALKSDICDDETYKILARVAASHSTNPLLQVLKVDLSEAPDEEISRMQKKFSLLMNKSKNEVIASGTVLNGLVDDLAENIFTIDGYEGEGDEYNGPRLRYFYNYVCTLPSFVKLTVKSIAATLDFPAESDSLRSYLLYRMDRSPGNIQKVYEACKPELMEIFSSGRLQDIRPDVKALITAYDRIVAIPNHRALMSDISKKIARWDSEQVDGNGINHAMFTLIEQASIYEPIIDKEKYDPASDGKGIWYSSFWTRRFAEGNEKVVYDILKELSQIEPKTIDFDSETEADPDDESNETELITCTFEDVGLGDCSHIIFSCGDYGDADTSALSAEEQQLWWDLAVDDENQDPVANTKYVGKSFSIRIGTTTGPACNDGQGGNGTIARILEFKLLE